MLARLMGGSALFCVIRLSGLLQGETVALGMLTQLPAGQGSGAGIAELTGYSDRLGRPASFAENGVRGDEDFTLL